MRRFQIAGSMLVAILAMSALGASAAMAADEIPAGTYTGKLKEGSAVFKAGTSKEECGKSTSEVVVPAGTKTGTWIRVKSLTFTECNPAAVSVCTLAEQEAKKSFIETKYVDNVNSPEPGSEELGPNDKIEYKIPPNCIKFTILTCTIEIAPTGSGGATFAGAYDDKVGTLSFVNVPVPFTGSGFGCPASPGTFSAVYGPVQTAGGVILADN